MSQTVNRIISVNWGTTGVSTLAYQVTGPNNSTLIGRTETGVTEYPAGSGIYSVTIGNWDVSWIGQIIWDDGSNANYASESFTAMAVVGYLSGQDPFSFVMQQTDGVETGLTLQQAARLMLAVLAGDSAGGGASFYDAATGEITRIASTVDSNGNRTVLQRNAD